MPTSSRRRSRRWWLGSVTFTSSSTLRSRFLCIMSALPIQTSQSSSSPAPNQ